MYPEAIGNGFERVVDPLQFVHRHPGRYPREHTHIGWVGSGHDRPFGRSTAGLVERVLQPALEICKSRLGLVQGDVPSAYQVLHVDLAHASQRLDGSVHLGLGVAGIVTLVVALSAVADHVDHHVLVEPLPVGECKPGNADAGFGVVAVHVQDRRLYGLGDVGAVLRGPGRLRWCGESELVVDHDVHRAAYAVALDLRHCERLGHHSLAGEGGIAVQQYREDRIGPVVVGRDVVHSCSGHSLDDRIHRFEV